MPAAAFRAAVERRDHDAIAELLAPDIVFFSPVTFRPFEGADAVQTVLRAALESFEDFEYVYELAGDHVGGLVFRARVGDRAAEGIDLLRFGNDGRIEHFTVMLRPMSAVAALAEVMAQKLEQLKQALGH